MQRASVKVLSSTLMVGRVALVVLVRWGVATVCCQHMVKLYSSAAAGCEEVMSVSVLLLMFIVHNWLHLAELQMQLEMVR